METQNLTDSEAETRVQIQAALTGIEAREGVRILYAVESGSRAWGFASPDSDWDVRFIYARNAEDYLVIDTPRDVIELPIAGDLDVNGWDLFKALGLFRKSNPPLLEWLASPIIYREVGVLAQSLRDIAARSYSPKRMAYHYLSMAHNNYKTFIAGRDAVSLKKYLYVMRPIICIRWIERETTPPPTLMADALSVADLPANVSDLLADLLHRKAVSGEMGKDAPSATLNRFIESEMTRIENVVANLPDPRIETSELNALAWRELGLPPSTSNLNTGAMFAIDTDENKG